MEFLVSVSSLLIFPKDYFISVIGVRTEIIGMAVIIFFGLRSAVKNNYGGFPPHTFIVSLLVVISWVGSVLANSLMNSTVVINSSSYYASFCIALSILSIKPKKMENWMIGMMAFNILLQFVEAVTGEFIYSYSDEDYVYDEKILSTDDGALRVKGLWASPLNAIGIMMSLAFMKPKSPVLWFMVCLSSALGQGRLGLGVGILGLLLILFFANKNDEKNLGAIKKITFLLLSAVSIVGVILFFGTESSVQRLLEASSSDNSQNVSRLLFWGQSINEISKYNLIEHLFGKFGYIKALQGGTESDWLRVWLDNGIICLAAYLLLAFNRLYKSISRRDVMDSYAVVATIFVMAVYPHAQSLANGILVWIFLFGGWYRHKANFN